MCPFNQDTQVLGHMNAILVCDDIVFLSVMSRQQDKGAFPLLLEEKKGFPNLCRSLLLPFYPYASQVPGPGFRCNEVVQHVEKSFCT